MKKWSSSLQLCAPQHSYKFLKQIWRFFLHVCGGVWTNLGLKCRYVSLSGQYHTVVKILHSDNHLFWHRPLGGFSGVLLSWWCCLHSHHWTVAVQQLNHCQFNKNIICSKTPMFVQQIFSNENWNTSCTNFYMDLQLLSTHTWCHLGYNSDVLIW